MCFIAFSSLQHPNTLLGARAGRITKQHKCEQRLAEQHGPKAKRTVGLRRRNAGAFIVKSAGYRPLDSLRAHLLGTGFSPCLAYGPASPSRLQPRFSGVRGFSHFHRRPAVFRPRGRKPYPWPPFPDAGRSSYARRCESRCREKHAAAWMNPFWSRSPAKAGSERDMQRIRDHRLKPVAKWWS